jgi:alpha-L-fucosidase
MDSRLAGPLGRNHSEISSDVVFFDWWIASPPFELTARFASFYYNYSLKNGGTVGVITYKDYAMHENSAVLDIERGQLAGIRPQYWQTDTSVSNKSWVTSRMTL